MSNPVFQASATTRLLRQRLASVPVGAVVSYDTLSTVVSEPVAAAHPSLQSARNSLLRHERIVFSPVRGEGLKRLSDAEIVAGADQDVAAIRRRARKGAVKITAVQDFAGLTPKDQLSHTTKLSVLTAVASMASDKGMRKVEAAATGRASELPIADTLRAFLAPA